MQLGGYVGQCRGIAANGGHLPALGLQLCTQRAADAAPGAGDESNGVQAEVSSGGRT